MIVTWNVTAPWRDIDALVATAGLLLRRFRRWLRTGRCIDRNLQILGHVGGILHRRQVVIDPGSVGDVDARQIEVDQPTRSVADAM
jgi:hypothetical protein